ncbi:DUF2937 family protein [Roseomonas elaeocarpi]|uniref:DUF2937 family protein n=1 Tax=Roseomonas elaeocarpi TaxID=907779 RepID=A0ABV6JTG8_9PROT
MGFIGRWLGDFVRLALALALAVAAMQLPALSGSYTAALLQIAEDGRRDIEARKALARQYYELPDTGDQTVIEALRPREPSNAQGLALSVEREGRMRGTYERLQQTPALLRPVDALWDALSDGQGDKRAVLRTAVATHEPSLILGTAAATYGLVGLLLGVLLAEALLTLLRALLGGMFRRRPRRQAAV